MLTIQVGHSYFLRFDRKQWERGKPYPPLATLHVAALLRRKHDAEMLCHAALDRPRATGSLIVKSAPPGGWFSATIFPR